MKDSYERELAEKKALLGYHPEDVQGKIKSLHQDHNEKLQQLIHRLYEMQGENLRLKSQLDEAKANIEKNMNPKVVELQSILVNVFLEHTKAIYSFKNELEMKETVTSKMLEIKQQKVEEAIKRVKDTMDYLQSLQLNYMKELDNHDEG